MNLYLRKALTRELERRGYEDAVDRVHDFEEYYYTGNETETEALQIMEDLTQCTVCGEYKTDEHLSSNEVRGYEDVCLDCKGDF